MTEKKDDKGSKYKLKFSSQYHGWRKLMTLKLRKRNLEKMVLKGDYGTMKKKSIDSVNATAMELIMENLDESLYNLVEIDWTPKQLWDRLEKRFMGDKRNSWSTFRSIRSSQR